MAHHGSGSTGARTSKVIPATVISDSKVFESGVITTDLPLGGSFKIVVNKNGDSTMSGSFHNSGLPSIAWGLVAVIMTPLGIGYQFEDSGSGGTFEGGDRPSSSVNLQIMQLDPGYTSKFGLEFEG